MARDSEILHIFTACDDALQGLVGLHQYTRIANGIIDNIQLTAAHAQAVVQLKITHEWVRGYALSDFFRHMQDFFEFRHCMSALMNMFPILEIALRRFRQRLYKLGKLGPKAKHYTEPDLKPLLKWCFGLLKTTTAGGVTMQQRLPQACGDIDNARRLRNLAMHNN